MVLVNNSLSSSSDIYKNILESLHLASTANTVKIYQNHGVKNECLGVSYKVLDKITKNIQKSCNTPTDSGNIILHEVALLLWECKIHEAMILACRFVDSTILTIDQLFSWLEEVDNHIMVGAISSVISRNKDASALALIISGKDDDWQASSGWSAIVNLSLSNKIEIDFAKELLIIIENKIHLEKNRTRYNMNNALISIAVSYESLTILGLEIAKKIGKVNVDHGNTSCKTPSAFDYITSILNYRKNKAIKQKLNRKII